MRHIFIGFYGWPEQKLGQAEAVRVIAEDFECWNLQHFSLKEFISEIKTRIPPINGNVLRNYLWTEEEPNFGITEKQYKDCRWGLLLPNPVEHGEHSKEITSLLSLYAPSFMRPAFYASDFGISVINAQPLGNWLHGQDRSELFSSPNFVEFFKTMLSALRYFNWLRDNVLVWTDEDWRLYMAASFYDDLEQYENSKKIYAWQRESADMATILEILFTAGDNDKEEVGYRLRKRASVLMGWRFPSIEKEIRDLYSDRSDLVHGSFYRKIVKGMRGNKNGDAAMPPPPNFQKLYETKERLRFLLVAYLCLNEVRLAKTKDVFTGFGSVQQILEAAIIDTRLREKVVETVRPVVDLLPEAQNGLW